MDKVVKLTDLKHLQENPLKEIIKQRHSCRSFSDKSLTQADLSFILWSSYGFKENNGRTVPSAGAIYPLNIYVLIQENGVEKVKAGFYRYLPQRNNLVAEGNSVFVGLLEKACLGQAFISEAPVNIIITGIYDKMKARYAGRAVRYTDIEVGHVCQNIYLACAGLALGTVEVGAFSDQEVARCLGLKSNETPLAIMPVGHPK